MSVPARARLRISLQGAGAAASEARIDPELEERSGGDVQRGQLARGHRLALLGGQSPAEAGLPQADGPEAGQLGLRRQRLLDGKRPLLQSHQGHGRAAVLPVYLRQHKALGVPEGVQRANQRRALARIVVQIQQREGRVSRRAQQDFDFLLVEQDRLLAGGLKESRRQVEHVLGGQVVAYQLEVPGGQYAGVLGDFVEVREEGPLADFVSHQGPIFGGQLFAEVRLGARSVDAPRPALGELPIGRGLAGRGRRVQVPRVFAAEHVDPAGQQLGGAAVFVAQRHEAERRMVAVGARHALELGLQEGVADGSFPTSVLAMGPSAWSITPSMSAAAKAASGGHQEWKRMKFSPYDFSTR